MYNFSRSINGLKSLNSDYIINSYDVTISGTLQSPITDLLSISVSTLDTKTAQLGVSSGTLLLMEK